MSPARRRRKAKAKKNYWPVLLFLGLIFILVFYFVTNKHFRSDRKLSVIINGESFVTLSTFDPLTESVTNIHIPKETEVKVARQLGTWKIGSVWKLGENESFGGRLLAETALKHFKFPVYVFADTPALGFSTGELMPVLRAILVPYKTNLGIGDRIRIGLFSLRVKNFRRVDINLVEKGFLKKVQLTGGEEGYLLRKDLSNEIYATFAEPLLSEKSAKVKIVDYTNQRIARDLGEVVEVLGAKTASIEEEDEKKIDCFVSGDDKDVTEIFSQIFSCPIKNGEKEGSFEVIVEIGQDFAKRY